MKTNRRNFLLQSGAATSGLLLSNMNLADPGESAFREGPPPDSDAKEAYKISIFSKCLQWLDYKEMSVAAADMGFDGIDLTVRPQGHVLPEKVSVDLPRAVEAIKQAGLEVYMITTAITDAHDPHTEYILRTASALGIRHYRMGWFHYDEKKGIEDNLNVMEGQMRKLAALNRKYSIYGEYQNHSGSYFGAPVWDLYTVLKKIHSPWLGVQYDIFHASIEGANAWPIGLKLLTPYIKSIDIKDFQWSKKEDKWTEEVVPLGQGFVDYKKYLAMLKQFSIAVPLSMHFEYALGGAEHGSTTLTIDREKVISSIKTDCATLRSFLTTAGLK